MDPCFNLTEERWIRVLTADGRVEEVTLLQALAKAQEYRALAGETATQNVAMLRFLLAVLYAALFGENTFETPEEAIDAWFGFWEAGRFPEEPIATYLNRWRERFWLFHDQRPFLQVPAGRDGITMENAADMAALEKPGKPSAPGVQKASKLNGAIFESGNKDNLFNIATGEGKYSVSFSEAARWLLHVIGFDDGSLKPYYKNTTLINRDSIFATCSKAAWVGRISPLNAEGDTLFETLLLNFVLLKDGEKSDEAIWPQQRPSWEYESLHYRERVDAVIPDNPAELLTFPFRRIMLIRRKDRVLGFVRYVGEAFSGEAATTEQWTLWERPDKKRGVMPLPIPRARRLPAQMWREMGSLLAAQGKSIYPPGVVRWLQALSGRESPLHNVLCRFHYTKAVYDGKESDMIEILDDSLSFSVSLLTEAGRAWVDLLLHELDVCSKVASQLGLLAEDLMSAEGGKVYKDEKKKTKTPMAMEQNNLAQEYFYYEVNIPFRQWLKTLRAEDDSETRHNRLEQLRILVRDTALRCGQEMLSHVSPAAYGKRHAGEGEDHPTAPQAWVRFKAAIRKLILIEQQGTGGA